MVPARDFNVSQVRGRWLKSYQLCVGVHQEEFANCQGEASLSLSDLNEAVISVLGKSSGFSGTLGKNQKSLSKDVDLDPKACSFWVRVWYEGV